MAKECTLYAYYQTWQILYHVYRTVLASEEFSKIAIARSLLNLPGRQLNSPGATAKWLEDFLIKLNLAVRMKAAVEP